MRTHGKTQANRCRTDDVFSLRSESERGKINVSSTTKTRRRYRFRLDADTPDRLCRRTLPKRANHKTRSPTGPTTRYPVSREIRRKRRNRSRVEVTGTADLETNPGRGDRVAESPGAAAWR